MAGPELNNGGERADKARLRNSMRVSPNSPIETFYPHHSGKFEEGSRRHFLELTTAHGFITRFMEHTAYTGVRGPRSILNRTGTGRTGHLSQVCSLERTDCSLSTWDWEDYRGCAR